MTIIKATHPAVCGLNTTKRIADIAAIANGLYNKPRIGLFASPVELASLSYVRSEFYGTVGNQSSKWNRATKCTPSGRKVLVGWRYVSHNGKCYEFERFALRHYDFPYATANYSPRLFYSTMETPDFFIIPSEGITVEEMLSRMVAV